MYYNIIITISLVRCHSHQIISITERKATKGDQNTLEHRIQDTNLQKNEEQLTEMFVLLFRHASNTS